MTGGQALSIFVRTAAGLALVALVAAQAADWTDTGDISVNAQTLGFGLLMAAIGGLIAVGHAFVASPAVSPMGKALRQAVQALVATPLAAFVIDSADDVVEVGNLLIPTVVAVVLAFVISLAANYAPVGTTTVPNPGSDALRGTSQ